MKLGVFQFAHTCIAGEDSVDDYLQIEWSDHITEFNASWLRASDEAQLPAGLANDYAMQFWDASFEPPHHLYKEGQPHENCKMWMKDLRKFGILLLHGVPQTKEGFFRMMHTFGPISQRIQPTNLYTIRAGFEVGETVDRAYGLDAVEGHTDACERECPAQLEAFLCLKYSAPECDTVSLFSDGLKIAENLRRENPEAYGLLASIPVKFGRFRLTTEEECPKEDVRIYQRNSVVHSPVIVTGSNGHPIQMRQRYNKFAGLDLSSINEELIMAYFKAYAHFQQKLDDPANQIKFILRPGDMVLFDNYRMIHGRSKVYPRTTRTMFAGYVDKEVYESRYRLLLSEQSRMEPKWIYGCSTASLEALAHRFQ